MDRPPASTRAPRALVALLAWVVFGVHAAAAPQDGPERIVEVFHTDDGITMIDARDETIIQTPAGASLHGHLGRDDVIEPTIRVDTKPDGYDVVYVFDNDTAAPKAVGSLVVDMLDLGDRVSFRDFTRTGKPISATHDTLGNRVSLYPGKLYWPCVVASNDRYTVGVSLQYPIVDYEHEARIEFKSRRPRVGEGYAVVFRLSSAGDEGRFDQIRDSLIQPGERRVYTVSVRVTTNPDRWLETLTPYREYFRSLYGGVRYTRKPEAITGMVLGMEDAIAPDNPQGYTYPRWRPDVHGWGPWVEQITARRNLGTVVLWKPTGVYRRHLENNFPFQFTSQWLADPEAATAIDPEVGLPQVPRAGIELGLWWGRSVQVSPYWDAPNMPPLDPDNPEHVAAGFRELDLAVRAGATTIGLDSYHHWFAPAWDLHRWLVMMQQRHPQVRFCTEPMTTDILHVLAPSFLRSWSLDAEQARTPDDLYVVDSPHLMADFLLPGHEIWLGIRYAEHISRFGIDPSRELVERDAARFAAMGYVPCILDENDPFRVHRAAPSWERTVPPDLQVAIRRNINFDPDEVIETDGGRLAIVSDAGLGQGAEVAEAEPPRRREIVVWRRDEDPAQAGADDRLERVSAPVQTRATTTNAQLRIDGVIVGGVERATPRIKVSLPRGARSSDKPVIKVAKSDDASSKKRAGDKKDQPEQVANADEGK